MTYNYKFLLCLCLGLSLFSSANADGNNSAAKDILETRNQSNDLICPAKLTTSIGDQCTAFLDLGQVLNLSGEELDAARIAYELIVQDTDPANGDLIDGPGSYTYEIVDSEGQVACDGIVTVVDSSPPSLICPPPISGIESGEAPNIEQIAFVSHDLSQIIWDTLIIFQTNSSGIILPNSLSAAGKEVMDITGYPEVTDNCGPVTVRAEDELIDADHPEFAAILAQFQAGQSDAGSSCTQYDQFIRRRFQATDQDQNLSSEPCFQLIRVVSPTLEKTTCPEDITLDCDDTFPLDENGNPHPDETGYPKISTALGTFDLRAAQYNLGTTYTDGARILLCENAYEFVRTWKIVDWCTQEIKECKQIIEVTDEEPPVVTCPEVDYDQDGVSDLLTFSTGPYDCTAAFEVPLPVVTDNCSDWEVSTEILSAAQDGPIVAVIPPGQSRYVSGLPLGCYFIKYVVTDDCGNRSVEYCSFLVEDQVAPIAACNEDLQVSTSDEGTARLLAANIDEGSTDNCGSVRLEVRRRILAGPDYGCLDQFDYDGDGIVIGDEIRESREAGDPDSDGSGSVYWYTPWLEYVDFTCCDSDENIRIELRVWDDRNEDGIFGNEIQRTLCAGPDRLIRDNANVCWLDVRVEDKQHPLCIPPAPIAIDCDQVPFDFDPADAAQMTELFGAATGSDNCPEYTVEELAPDTDNISDCGFGTFVRYFRVSDARGLASLDTCKQVVTLEEQHSYIIRFPFDVTVNCSDPFTFEPLIIEQGCDLLATSSRDETFSTSGEECYTIYRTHSVINWCEYDGISDPVELTSSFFFSTGFGFFSGGYYEYTQQIEVIDLIEPFVNFFPPAPFCSYSSDLDNDCPGEVILDLNVLEFCTPDDVTITLELDMDQDGVFDGDVSDLLTGSYPNYQVVGNFPLGTHAIVANVKDGCGNEKGMLMPFEVIDCKAPTPTCINGLAIQLMPVLPHQDVDGDGIDDKAAMTVWATDFIASPAPSDCSEPIHYSMNLSAHSVDSEQSNLTLTCKDSGRLVEIWAWDEQGNGDFCQVYLLIQDNSGLCSTVSGAVAGMVTTEDLTALPGVEVDLSGAATDKLITAEDGHFNFSVLEEGFDYTLTPSMNVKPLHGVSTFDLVLLSKHILGEQRLDSPYKMIAADVNNDQRITAQDAIALRRVILNVETKFAANTSWRFIDAAFEFSVPDNPWADEFPEVININSLQGTWQNADFVGVKVGDLNRSGQAIEARSGRNTFALETTNATLQAGQEYEVTISASQLAKLQGFQGTLTFDQTKVEVVDIRYGAATSANFGLHLVKEGMITLSWDGKAENNEALFTLVLRAAKEVELSEVLKLNSRVTLAEAYNEQDEVMDLTLDFNPAPSETPGFELYQNVPNPFKSQTTVAFDLPVEAELRLRIQDVQGRTLQSVSGVYASGKHQLQFTREQLKASGILFYTLTAGEYSVTKKMLLVE